MTRPQTMSDPATVGRDNTTVRHGRWCLTRTRARRQVGLRTPVRLALFTVINQSATPDGVRQADGRLCMVRRRIVRLPRGVGTVVVTERCRQVRVRQAPTHAMVAKRRSARSRRSRAAGRWCVVTQLLAEQFLLHGVTDGLWTGATKFSPRPNQTRMREGTTAARSILGVAA